MHTAQARQKSSFFASLDTPGVRTIKEGELDSWLDLLEISFQEKGTPRDYFASHVHNDPFFVLEAIFVRVDEGTQNFISTLRVFHRRAYFGEDKELSVGGIGEVATHPDHQGKGLASQVLRVAVEYMCGLGMEMSSLHATPPIDRVYAKNGWCTVPRFWAVVPISSLDTDAPAPGSVGISYKLGDLKWEDDVRDMQPLYAKFSKLFCGPIVRNNSEYWNKWIRPNASCGATLRTTNGVLLGYVVVAIDRKAEKCLRIVDMALDPSLISDGNDAIAWATRKLFLQGVQALCRFHECSNFNVVKCAAPACIIGELQEDPTCFMYRSLDTDRSPGNHKFLLDRVFSPSLGLRPRALPRGDAPNHHVFWDVDGF